MSIFCKLGIHIFKRNGKTIREKETRYHFHKCSCGARKIIIDSNYLENFTERLINYTYPKKVRK